MSINASKGYILWMVGKLQESKAFEKIEVADNGTLVVITTEGESYSIGAVNTGRITCPELNEYLEGKEIDFLSVKGGVEFISGDAMKLLEQKEIGVDSFGHIASSLRTNNPLEHIDKENFFINRVFKQHSHVSSVERETNKKYRIKRRGMADLVIVAVNDYDMTAGSVRDAIGLHGNCDIVFASNPNGRLTTPAKEAADSIGVELYKLSDLLRRISR
ncbi:TPA: hypothetical protein M3A60_001399 [Cronobacter sakazakii]|nr:hypothetical protein [Cronobacter malonaticus]HCC0171930.1 hypothetical protein [Cronobacter sakazakii]HCC0174863.1 hypothetical protein [Cronobacter sakazakii]HCC0189883.1 hypothetical protein [Cronobacter sakazakii]HCC0202004.1 hypothetical protein [Cronobacter sakazakii]HCC0209630.1 hypothetical protein [Cronobacter sakazakii]